MKITTAAAQLATCLETVEKALPVRTTIPATGNILLESEGGLLTFTATNHEIMINVIMDYPGGESGKLLIPPKIVDIVRHFPTPEINMEINPENYRIDITGGAARFHLYGSSADDFPLTALADDHNGEDEFALDLSTFKKLLKEVVFAASCEETRPAFNGVLFSFSGTNLTLTASDTYRLVIRSFVDDKWSFKEKKCLVPAKALREFLRLAGDGTNELVVSHSDSLLSIRFGQIYFASRLLEEKYPDVSGVIPREYKTRITVDSKMLEETISRAALFTEGKNQAVNLAVKNEHAEIKVNSQVGSMEETMPVEQDGEDLDLFVNSRFILELLKILETEKVIIDFHGDGGPLIFRIPDDSSYLYLVLPIKKVT